MILSSAMVFSFTVYAQDAGDYQDHVLSDGKLSEQELAAVVAVAQKDLKKMTERSVEAVGDEMAASGVFPPMAWMMMRNGEIKAMKLGESGEEAPGNIKVIMYRAGLKSIARRNEIHAALIAYPGQIEKDGEQIRIMAIEHEHRLGVSGLKLIPVTLSAGEPEFGDAMSQEKPFQIFYDEKKGHS
ncbi:hypothetical protein DYI22_00725 [Marinobacter lipolyticus]|nr:hypothetical protein [Marinobacter lipolyticus]